MAGPGLELDLGREGRMCPGLSLQCRKAVEGTMESLHLPGAGLKGGGVKVEGDTSTPS